MTAFCRVGFLHRLSYALELLNDFLLFIAFINSSRKSKVIDKMNVSKFEWGKVKRIYSIIILINNINLLFQFQRRKTYQQIGNSMPVTDDIHSECLTKSLKPCGAVESNSIGC